MCVCIKIALLRGTFHVMFFLEKVRKKLIHLRCVYCVCKYVRKKLKAWPGHNLAQCKKVPCKIGPLLQLVIGMCQSDFWTFNANCQQCYDDFTLMSGTYFDYEAESDKRQDGPTNHGLVQQLVSRNCPLRHALGWFTPSEKWDVIQEFCPTDELSTFHFKALLTKIEKGVESNFAVR